MAGSRLEKIGTIYTRTRGLIKLGAMKWEDRPLWYDIYEAFPPMEEPRFDRIVPKTPLKNIFYEEDRIRAIFHKRNKQIGSVNLSNSSSKSVTQRFIEAYKKAQSQCDESASEEEIYQEAINLMQTERQAVREETHDEPVNLVQEFKLAMEKEPVPNIGIKISDIMKS